MQDSRLPCFGRGAPIPNLRKRFHLDMTEAKAAAFMRSTILDAYDNVMSFPAVLFKGSELPPSVCMIASGGHKLIAIHSPTAAKQ